ncbi:MAG: quinone oxidoreductase [Alphaproteobacteria bacterium TMED89]|nr:quinone oxidoreductase [Rhodospirillaceae bacterium]RPH19944.1 MAG: quinone oxidoreductase [Alphaproteobacteria bacterium TMED89]
MSKAVVIHQTGGREVLTIEDREVGMPGPGQLRIRNTHIGLNYIDVYFREGLYGTDTPFVPGAEGAGYITDIGEGVKGFKVGDRVATVVNGAYCEERLVEADKAVILPEEVSNEAAAAIMLKGMTVQYLFKQSYAIQPGQSCLFHAAAGGVGLLACQWAKAINVKLIGTAGTGEKCQLALDHGAAHCVNYRDEDWVEQVRELSGGGVPVVYDSVGKSTVEGSLDCLKPLGYFITFGNASGPVRDFSAAMLASRGSLYMQRPTLFTYIASRAQLNRVAGDLFNVVRSGDVKPVIGRRLPLAEVAEAHRGLEARETIGSTILEV